MNVGLCIDSTSGGYPGATLTLLQCPQDDSTPMKWCRHVERLQDTRQDIGAVSDELYSDTAAAKKLACCIMIYLYSGDA
jgi:hypothetical protein